MEKAQIQLMLERHIKMLVGQEIAKFYQNT